MAKKKKKSISLWPVVHAIDETIEKLAAARRRPRLRAREYSI